MILSTNSSGNLQAANRSINHIFVHESVQYFKNQMGGTFRIGSEERYAEMLEQTIYEQDIASINDAIE